MRVLFFGLGSIGRRHLHNLKTVLEERNISADIEAFRSGIKIDNDFTDIKMIYSEKELADYYDLVFITNPTNQHYTVLKMLFERTDFFFIEKPVFEDIRDIEEFLSKNNQCYVACPLRHKKIYLKLKEIVANNTIYSARVIASSYLPEWRESDYRTSYSAKSNQGGGVELDCIHEIDYISDLFGIPIMSQSNIQKISNLEINSNDHASYILDYGDKVIDVHLDYYGKHTQRNIELISNENFYKVDFISNTITVNGVVDEVIPEERNDFYLREMNYFLDIVFNKKKNINTLQDSLDTLKIAKGYI